MGKKIKPKFGLCGLGNIASRHIQAIEDIGGEIVDTYDVDSSRNPSCDSYEDLLMNPDANWIVILSPNKLHYEQAKMALAVGKSVIVEKPPVTNLFDLWSFDLEDNIYTISQLRYMESIKNLRMKVKDSDGYTVRLNIVAHRDPIYLANWRGRGDWSGGILYTIGIHYFDILTWIFGGLKKIDYVRWMDDDWRVQGRFELQQGTVEFNIEVSETKPNHKSLVVDDLEIDLAAGFFDLHSEVYKDIFAGGGVHPLELNRAINLIDHIYAN